MSQGVTTGLFALGGVIIGGLLNVFGTYLMDRRKDRYDGRTAARMIFIELRDARRDIAGSLKADRKLMKLISTERWTEWEQPLAARLDGRTWSGIREVYYTLDLLNDALKARSRTHIRSFDAKQRDVPAEPPPLGAAPLADEREWLEACVTAMDWCLVDLAQLAGVDPMAPGELDSVPAEVAQLAQVEQLRRPIS